MYMMWVLVLYLGVFLCRENFEQDMAFHLSYLCIILNVADQMPNKYFICKTMTEHSI